ncbi:DUF2789 domain-containing protein [Photobacterium aphoticum]|uniref:DUF2789 domain-containing protein n=1 Tax=Photobacterium aphoticum TaxID=754436 RepID=A0A090RJG7_9GAMM|nr:DUF2789 domain-containing protein [Photobacterium aphoticum]KLV01507.1 hypothetical protein ABT58_07635 [Photobacterium aphoticum]PSU55247.1 DUF2789 domain-containing protein [Photobacterium aphoticum]GAL07657.1 hypothetical protein JCM19237_895 [Photobacterium aphoticum]GHA59662.1 hypothetical protein GCM10007086_36840 [Photobacterium aphoticum]
MERFNHDLSALFSQLGLNNSHDFIEQFLSEHHLAQHERLADASFWRPAQKRFIQESQEQDADWCEVIDQLDALLRK